MIVEVNGGYGVVTADPILNHQYSTELVCVFQKQRVMAYAQADNNVKFHTCIVQKHGLTDGVAGGFKIIFRMDKMGLGNTKMGLVRSAALAADGFYLDSGVPKQFGDYGGFLFQSGAEGDTYMGIAHALTEHNGFFQPRKSAVGIRFQKGAFPEKMSDFGVFICKLCLI